MLGVVLLVVSVAAQSGDLHEFLHGGDYCESGAGCAVAMFGSGSVASAPTETEVFSGQHGWEAILAAVADPIIGFGSLSQPVARGPPDSFPICR